ncbi:MAG TPA: hypothetical protein VN258_18950 [Mobilitalea sp.]|nr:hypothetical protein [Mobilitalea sp.]
MRDRYIPPFITLIAGAITSIINIVNKVELVTGLKRLLIVIIIFYFIGLITKEVINVALTKFAKKEQTEETQEEDKQPDGKNS